ncbi:hypothetical protein NDU88_005362 [Pleurodeles waltl]|uniref:Uncharacterized protein n=1 Tax=Pleurodeles waltl TaxID=8319 RepID=A0AAV7VLJ6_PLEWA|nr:hypothetical protein NDU88_005362 [Pleurodeles waltl]
MPAHLEPDSDQMALSDRSEEVTWVVLELLAAGYIDNVPIEIVEILQQFATLSGLRVNWVKSCLLPFNHDLPDPCLYLSGVRVPCLWQSRTFRYFGIYIFHKEEDLHDRNLRWTVSSIRSKMHFCQTLPLSVAGKIALLKMVVLSRLLNSFSNLPYYVPTSFFRELEPRIREFIWNKVRCRVALKKLYSLLTHGSLSEPNMEQYYLASQLQWVVHWLSGLRLSDTATSSSPWTLPQILNLFHPLTNARTPVELLLNVAHCCNCRCLRLTSATIPYAPALALLAHSAVHDPCPLLCWGFGTLLVYTHWATSITTGDLYHLTH